MYGVKLYSVPKNLDATIQLWHQLGFDTLFIGQACKTDSNFLERLQTEGFFVNLIEPVFLADETTDKKLLAITKDGTPASDTWVRFVCPTNKEWLDSFYERFTADSKLNVNSLSLDFIRFFQFWEVINPDSTNPNLKETCYCPRCLEQRKTFRKENPTNSQLEDDELWRCSIINQIVKNCLRIKNEAMNDVCTSEANNDIRTNATNSNVKKLGLHAVPWKKSTFNGALSRILGQDLSTLSKSVDFFTPMAYHHMLHQNVSYIKDLMEDLENQINVIEEKNNVNCRREIVPSVQLKKYYRDEDISLEENFQTIMTAMEAGHGNVVYFQWTDIEENPKITALLKDFYKNYICHCRA